MPAPPAARRRAETHSEIQPSATTLSLSPMPTALAAALTGQKQTHFLAKASMSFCNAVRNPTPRIAPRHSPMPISMDTPFAAFSFAAAGARPADAGAHTLIQLAASTAIRSRARTISAARHAPGPPVSWGRQQRGSVGVVRANRGQVRSGTLLLLAAAGALGTLCVPESHAQSYVMLTRSGAGGRTEPGPNLARLNCFSRQPARQHSSNWDKGQDCFFSGRHFASSRWAGCSGGAEGCRRVRELRTCADCDDGRSY